MKFKCLFLFSHLVCFCLVSCISVDDSHLQANGDYVSESGPFGGQHKFLVQKTSSLTAFGITKKDWQEKYGEAEIYKAFSWLGGSLHTKEEVKQKALDAIKVVANNRNNKYYAILNQDKEADSQGNLTLGGSFTEYTFQCDVVFFDDESVVNLLRKDFGNINVYEK